MLRGLYQNLFDNPILTRELRRRMRGKALIASIILYITIMAVTTVLILLASFNPISFGQETTAGQLARMTDTGQRLFMGIFVIQSLLVLIIAPTITAGMTTAEKEKKTFDFLRVTTITPWMYILGCFLSTTFYVALALLCALPLISLAFLYGGVGRDDVVRLAVQLLTTSMVLSAFGLLISSLRERTRTAQGIVVFVIFALLFGGGILFQRLSVWLGIGGGGAMPVAGPGTAGAAGGGAASVTVMGLPIDPFLIGILFSLFLTAVLLIMATRKLFDTEESRALSHWQFALISVLVMGIQLAFASGQALSNITYLLFMSLGGMLLITAVFCFGVGRMEVGDEIWHLKRLFPLLRPFDQTVPFLVLVGLGWWYAAGALERVVANLGPLNAGALQAAAGSMLLVYIFLCIFARFATAVAVGRRGASRMTFVAALVTLFGTLILGGLFALLFVDSGSAHTNLLSRELIRLSPLGIMIEAINQPAVFANSGMRTLLVPSILYLGMALVLGALGEYKRFVRWRGFDYHYDMPSR